MDERSPTAGQVERAMRAVEESSDEVTTALQSLGHKGGRTVDVSRARR